MASDLGADAAALPQRQAVGKLTNADGTFKSELQIYHDALEVLKSEHPLLWTQLSKFHDIFCTGAGANEVHGNWRFLAWHRAYLLTYERVLREVSGKATLAVPYWDWFASDTFPSAFTVGALNHPKRNLNSGNTPVITASDRGRWENANYDARVPFAPQSPFRPPSFFGWRGPNGQRGLAESNGHGGMHNWVGGIKVVNGNRLPDGDMSDLNRAANDPCFFSHHGNVDRMWEVWKTDVFGGSDDWKDSIPADWKSIVFTFDFGDGRSYAYKSMDLLDTETAKDADGVSLGYTYDSVTPRTPLPGPRPLRAVMTVSSIENGPRSASGPTLAAERAESGSANPVRIPLGGVSVGDQPKTTAAAPLAAPERARAAGILKEAESLASPAEGGRNLAAGAAPVEGRVVVRLGRIELPPRNVQLRFFLNNPDASPVTPDSDPSFIGSFNYIPSSGEPEIVEGFELDITKDVGDKLSDLPRAQVTVVPEYAGEKDQQVRIEEMVLEVR